jgi:MFS family permease
MMHAMDRSEPQPTLSRLQWLLCGMVALGFAFNQYEILVAPLIIRPVLNDLGGLRPGSAAYNLWAGLLLFLPAATGGMVGLLGGYLTDRFGRRRALVWSILVYGGSSCAAAFTDSLAMFLLFRCATWTGVCVESVAAIAWLAEMLPNPRQRESALGYTQAFIGIGGLMVTGVYYLAVTYGEQLPAIHGGHEAWRYTMACGLIPAVPLMLIRPFAPESPVWQAKHTAGTLRRPRFRDLFQPALRRTTLLTTCLVACCYALPYGAIQHTPRIVPGLPELRAASPRVVEQTVSTVQLVQELGALAGRLLFSAFMIAR